MNDLTWKLEEVGDSKFPLRLTISQDGKSLLCLRVQEKWPGTKGQIFCLSEQDELAPVINIIEHVPVISFKRYGKRIAITLDRSINKRCDFLFLRKEYKNKPGEYDQIFWRTQQALKGRKPRAKLSLRGSNSLQIIIDSGERYAWRFAGCDVNRASLPVGDYALFDEVGGIMAVVERKTFDNMVAEFGRLSSFHQSLGELEAYSSSALVVEASYSDFLNPTQMKYYNPGFAAKVFGELHAMHPKLPIIFAGSRKLANEWTLKFFSAIKSHQEDKPLPIAAEAIAKYKAVGSNSGGRYYLAKAILTQLPLKFTTAMLRAACPDVPDSTLRKILNDLKKDGKIFREGHGKKSYWLKIE